MKLLFLLVQLIFIDFFLYFISSCFFFPFFSSLFFIISKKILNHILHSLIYIKCNYILLFLYNLQVVTFDENGVSYHPNHISTYKGVLSALTILKKRNKNIVGYKLISTNDIRKFYGVFDLPFSHICSYVFSNIMVVNFNLFLVMKGMHSHRSQNVWYRILFIIFSRYSYINTFITM